MSKKPSNFEHNSKELEKLCEDNGYELVWLSAYQARILSGVTIVDVWPSRMIYNVLNVDGVEKQGNWRRLDFNFNAGQVKKVLETGAV